MLSGIRTVNVSALFLAFAVVFGLPRVCQAQTCAGDSTPSAPWVCVDWSGGADPEAGTDFAFDFTDPDNPDVTLYTGDDGWVACPGEARTCSAAPSARHTA